MPDKLPPKHARSVLIPCSECGALSTFRTATQYYTWKNKGRAHCSPACRDAFVRRNSSEIMARTNRQYASARMKERNPMRDASTRQKVSETLRAMKHAPSVRGGNGHQMPVAQALLLSALGPGWVGEMVVRTGAKKGSGVPCHYKVDIGNAALKMCVEVDGGSHAALSRREQDNRKDSVLRSLGYEVLRFTNQQVAADMSACIRSIISKLRARTPILRTV